MLNHKERTTFVRQYFEVTFKNMRVVFFDELTWGAEIELNAAVDLTGAHKPNGVLGPEYVQERFTIGVCPELLVRHAQDASEEDFQALLTFWGLHLCHHIILRAEHLPADREEEEVNELMAREFGELVTRTAEMRHV